MASLRELFCIAGSHSISAQHFFRSQDMFQLRNPDFFEKPIVVEIAIFAEGDDGFRLGELNDREQLGIPESGSDCDQTQSRLFGGKPDEKQLRAVWKLHENQRVALKTQIDQRQ